MSKLKKIISAVTAAALLCSAVAFKLPEKIAAAVEGDGQQIETTAENSEPAVETETAAESSEPAVETEPAAESSEQTEETEPAEENSEQTEPTAENPEQTEPAEENSDNQIMTYAVNEGHADHNICGESGCSHDGAHEALTDWVEVSNINDLQNAISGNQSVHCYLANDITVDSSDASVNSAVQIGGSQTNPKDIVLCLNGHSISIDSGVTKRIFFIRDKSTFTICDCNGNGKLTGGNPGSETNYGPHGGAVYIVDGTFNMYGGEISSNNSTDAGGAVYMQNGTFNMYGGKILNNTSTNSGGGVYKAGGTFNMYGGEISGNTAGRAGGCMYNSTGTFNMYDGTISNNTASINAGGVFLNNGTMNMSGGTISNNRSTKDSSNGGGVLVSGSSGTFTMSGGKILNNSAPQYGGGVYTSASTTTFDMQGGEISGNSAQYGGGVYVIGTFTMSGGTITNNTATSNGGGIYSNNAFTLNGIVTITGNKLGGRNNDISLNNANNSHDLCFIVGDSFSAPDPIYILQSYYPTHEKNNDIIKSDSGDITPERWKQIKSCFTASPPNSGEKIYVAYNLTKKTIQLTMHKPHTDCAGTEHDGCNHTEAEWYGIDDFSKIEEFEDGGHYYLTGDVTITKAIEITKNITLCLNGHKISQGSSFSTNNKPSVIINNQNGKLVLCDCNTDKKGTITGDSSIGSIVDIHKGVFEMYGGNLSESGSGGNGAGVCISGSSKFNMYGGTISGNKAYEGGGVSTFDTSVFNMYGGTISGNSSRTASSGGVLVSGTSTFNMYGGEITNNTAATNSGGIHVGSTATFNMYGGSITGNTANIQEGNSDSGKGGGVYVLGTMNLDGAVNISGNTGGESDNNITFKENAKLTIGNAFRTDNPISIKFDGTVDCQNPVAAVTGTVSADSVKMFTPEEEGQEIVYIADESGAGTLQLTVPHKWSDWVVTKNPTTTDEGEASRTCSNSNHAAVPETKTLPKVVFTPTGGAEPGEGGGGEAGEWEVTYTPPTMDTPGKYVYENEDGIIIEVEIPELNPADGESIWEKSETGNTPPSIDQPGTYTYTSDEFGEIKVTVPPLNKIDDDGNKIWTKSEEEGKNEDPTPDAPGKYTYTSEEYGEITVDVPALSDDSVWTKKIVKEPTCTKDGECEYTNDIYGAVKGVVPATGHSLKKQDREEPTCTNEGTEEYWYCETCKALFSDELGKNAIEKPVSIPKTEHTEVTDPAVPATCTEDGKTEGSHCSVCGEVIKAQETVPAKGHTEVTDPAVPATCTEDGKTEGSHCSVCGEVIKAQETVPAKGHTWGEWTVKTPATETEKGEEVRECSVCHETEYKEIPATGETTTDPENPDNPDDPTNPDNPDDPTNPDNPDDPTNPDNPDDPTNPDNPDDPEKPGDDDNVSTGENTPDTKLETPEDELIKAVLTPEEQEQVEEGAEVKIVLTVEDGTNSVSDEDKAKVEEVISEDPDWKVIQYLDVSLLKTVDGKQERVTKTEEPLRIVFVIPENMRGGGRRYAVIRVHEGETAVLFDLDSDPNTVTIETNRFSTYALTYTMIPSVTPPTPGSTGDAGGGGSFTSPGTGGSDNGDTEPGESGTSSGGNGTATGGEGSSSGDNGTSSGNEGSSSGDNGTSSGNEGSSSGGNGTSSGGNGTSFGDNGTSSGGNGTSDNGTGTGSQNGASSNSNEENGGENAETSTSAINIGNIFFGNDNNPATGLAVSMILPAAAALAALIGCARKKK